VIIAENLSKRYGERAAVDGISFTVRPGLVTGFLGPNGAGKSTTMRMIVGLDRPSAGRVTINGKAYAEHPSPLHEVGAMLDARAVHPGRTARSHLRALAATHSIPRRRVDEVVSLAGLDAVADKRVGGFSLGMGQRLGIAAALLGDPATLILDEPVNGLDPEGVIWVRKLARHLAGEGRTVFLSSHLMSEMSQTADHLLVLGRGKLIADAPVAEIVAGATTKAVLVRSPEAARLAAAIVAEGGTATAPEPDRLDALGLPAARIGELAAAAGIVLHELTPQSASLEEAYLELTQDDVEYRSGAVA
jgi:ABC-2 type transport system ATP-binding protein